jgi:Domain of unknown function (DUF4186)
MEPAAAIRDNQVCSLIPRVFLMNNLDQVFQQLERSDFRRRFRLRSAERDYLARNGLEVIMAHAGDFIDKRLAPAAPLNDGKQTPMGKHPVFVAQHATATCCRGCLEKWHAITKGHALSDQEKNHVLAAIRRWLVAQQDQ